MQGTSQHTAFGTLFREGGPRYVIPTYQRGYSWEPEHVGQFLEDLDHAHGEGIGYTHFFGYVLMATDSSRAGRALKIIDGQQRITTATLFLICARNFFWQHEKIPLARKHCARMEEYLHKPAKMAEPGHYDPVLALSRTNKRLFMDMVKERPIGKRLDSIHSQDHDSNELLAKAYEVIRAWFEKKIADLEREQNRETALERLIEDVYDLVTTTLFEKFVIHQYHYDNAEEAYRIFNLVNNRGMALNESDLVKSYLFSRLENYISDDDIDACEQNWNDMRRNVTSRDESSYKDLDTFLRHYLIAYHGEKIPRSGREDGEGLVSFKLNQKHMHKAFNELVDDYADKKEIIDDLLRCSNVLNNLRNPNTRDFSQHPEITHYLKKIRDMNAVFVYPAILSAHKRYWDVDDRDVDSFTMLVTLCFRYHVRVKVLGTAFSTGDYERVMYSIAHQINSGVAIRKIIGELTRRSKHYPKRHVVLGHLEDYATTSRRHAVALLEEVERRRDKRDSAGDVSIEHIMPKKYKKWVEYIMEQEKIPRDDMKFALKEVARHHRRYVNYLGNQTLLQGKSNAAIANKPFKDKKTVYKSEGMYHITREVAEYEEWNARSIMARQKRLASAIAEQIDLEPLSESRA